MREAASDRWLKDLDRHWVAWVLIAWVAFAAYQVGSDWNAIRWLSLGDTDDNMRLMQVRAWLAGQDWYDLRQYRMNPPAGFDMHWSRLVDLPLAGLILLFDLFTTRSWAERLACGIAPLLPLAIALLGLGATVRRLVHPLAWTLAILVFLTAFIPMLMFGPMRTDHHGWQLAMLSVTLAGLSDPRRGRGGMLVGLASALSLSIGLEMLPYAAMAGGILALRWVFDRDEAGRLQAYALTLGGGTAAGFALFASNANWTPRCDALTPVWLSVTVVAGGLLFALARLNPATLRTRLILALVVGGGIAIGFAGLFPQCLTRPEQVSDELANLWLNNVKEAKPIWGHPLRIAFPIAALPVVGLIGAGLAIGRAKGSLRADWLPVSLFASFAVVMLTWQVRSGPAAQLLAVPGVTALGWVLIPWLRGQRSILVRVFGPVAVLVVVMAGLFASTAVGWFRVDRPNAYQARVNRATGECMRTSQLLTLNRYPRARVFTFVDLGPRLITVTHHDAIAGPYHRNGDAILAVKHAFGRSPDEARGIIRRSGATLLLVCPNMAESTVFRARNKGGFYDRLARGERFGWLEPLPMPARSPYTLYRVR